MYTRIQKWGNSQAVRLPKALLASVGLKEKDEVRLVAREGAITIIPAVRHRTLPERVAEYKGDYRAKEWDTGKPVGKEEL